MYIYHVLISVKNNVHNLFIWQLSASKLELIRFFFILITNLISFHVFCCPQHDYVSLFQTPGLFRVDTFESMRQTLYVSRLPHGSCPGPESVWMTVTLVINHCIRISNVNATVAWITCHICSLESAASWLPSDLLEIPVWGIIGQSKDQPAALSWAHNYLLNGLL